MENDKGITKWFGKNLAELLGSKISLVYADFDKERYVKAVSDEIDGLSYTQRIDLHANILKKFLPEKYTDSIGILTKILGEENPNETGMFTYFYWIMPIGKFIEKNGLDDFEVSMKALEEVTKRNTGEYAVRPFIRKYPEKSLQRMTQWSKSKNFHLRRLASEGIRPKLPWATKLETFIQNPEPVFKILNNLIEDDSKFVQKSVANNIRDYLKVNKEAALTFMKKHSHSENKNTQWILKHATRKMTLE